MFSSWLDQVPGVGVKTKEKILKKIKVSPAILREYEVDQISSELEVSSKIAEKIKSYLLSVDDVNSLSD